MTSVEGEAALAKEMIAAEADKLQQTAAEATQIEPLLKIVKGEPDLAKNTIAEGAGKLQQTLKHMKDSTLALVKDPSFQKCTISTGCGAVTLGAIGGAFGTATGVLVGSAAGLPLALLTFGLSVPAGAALGGSVGLCAGTVVGGGAGGLVGCGAYKYRVEIKDSVVYVKVKSTKACDVTKVKVAKIANDSKEAACNTVAIVKKRATAATLATRAKIGKVVDVTTAKTGELATLATTTRTGVTSVSAAAGGVIGSTTGGAVGTVAGAAVGLVPALFTFGLSIPVCATMGLCAGTAVGGAAGTVGAGALGYGGFTYREEIKGTACSAWTKTSDSVAYIKARASERASSMRASAKALVSSGTGGTEPATH